MLGLFFNGLYLFGINLHAFVSFMGIEMTEKGTLILLGLFGLLTIGLAQADDDFSYRAKVMASDTSQWPRTYILLEVVSEDAHPFPGTYADESCQPATSEPHFSECWIIDLSSNGQPLHVDQQHSSVDLASLKRGYLWLSYLSNSSSLSEQTLQLALRARYRWGRRSKKDQAALVIPVAQQADIVEAPWPYLSKLLDTQLNQRWSMLPEGARKKLIAGQRAWLAYRDADCEYQTKSLLIPREKCLYQQTELRLLQLPALGRAQ